MAITENTPTVTREDERKSCIFVDPSGIHHDALITRVWGPQCVNIVFVHDNEKQEDTYGRKIVRYTSVMHRDVQQAHGNFWYFN